MKHWVIYLAAAAIVIVFGWLPFPVSDVGDLQPLEVLYVYRQNGELCLASDTGDHGRGATLEAAFQDLREGAAGEIFMDTADYVLLGSGTEDQVETLWKELRPGCQVCSVSGEPDLEQTADFLSTHEPGMTLLRLRTGETKLPILLAEEGEMRLVQP